MAYLEFETPKGPRRLEVRESKPITIGRQPANVVSLDDDKMSRYHAVVEKREDGCYIRDLGSRNGSAVNNVLVQVEQKLAHGDIIRTGSHVFRYYSGLPGGGGKSVLIGSKPVDESLQINATSAAAGEGVLESASATMSGTISGAGSGAGGPTLSDEPSPRWSAGITGEASGVGPARQLAQLAESLPHKPFTLNEIELINGRGDIVHGSRDEDATGIPAEAVTILRLILLVCFRTRASDIHIEPKGETWQVRVRADGSMVTVAGLKKDLGVRLLSVVKILCDIDISVRNAVQEGSFVSRVPDRKVDYRVSMTPSIFGQKLVIRCLDSANSPRYLWDLNLPEAMFRTIEKGIKRDAGMLLVCGPTGSGKTSTLYAVLRSIDASERNVVTIEDPVEIQIPGVTQMPVNEDMGSTFHSLLRSTLRQDPDVILVGEIRDAETAKTAMQAAMTGHLVFSTVHARDTIGSVFRLLDLGIEPFLIASGLNLLLAQRLIRTLCPFCKAPAAPTDEQLREMGSQYESLTTIYRAVGCIKCLGTGYSGRRGVFELLVIDEIVRAAIGRNNQGDVLQALNQGRIFSLKTHGFSLAAEGITTYDEVDRVVGE
ncbi:MAG: Flp pilus assembly complex ATPase component TadA [Burkholderiales bacterium]|nr:Flp pilus assembly complex ATPase component TadA [Phycisphaerae bacterium]